MTAKMTQSEVGVVGEFVNSNLTYWRENCPRLVTIGATLLPFADVIDSADGGSYPDGEPYILIRIRHPDNRRGRDATTASITTKRVTISQLCDMDNPEEMQTASYDCELPALWEYLRQLPRPPSTYGRART